MEANSTTAHGAVRLPRSICKKYVSRYPSCEHDGRKTLTSSLWQELRNILILLYLQLVFVDARYLGLIPLASDTPCTYASLLLDASVEMVDMECNDRTIEVKSLEVICSNLLVFSLQVCHDSISVGTSIERVLSAVRRIARLGINGGIPQALSPFLPALALLCTKSTGRSRHTLLGTICEVVKVCT